MTDRYERADESSERKAVQDAEPAPPNPTEDEPVKATSAVEDPTSPVETSPAGCNLVETATTAQPATTQKAGTAPNANHTCGQAAGQTQQFDEPKLTAATGSPLPRQPEAPTQRKVAVERSHLMHDRSARKAARGGPPAVVLVGGTAHGQGDLAAAMLGCAGPRGLAMRPICTQRSSGSCWTQRI
jgi:hypothetical protein